jgi:hypothetical protein
MPAISDNSALQTPEAVWTALAALPKGPQRAALLQDDRVRNLILNSGAFVILSAGAVDGDGQTLKDKLAPVRIIQTHRLRTLKDTGDVVLDGRGTFGGLSERSRASENLAAKIAMPLQKLLEKTVDEFIDEVVRPKLMALVKQRDDLTVDGQGRVIPVSSRDEIGRTTVAREMMEEAVDELDIDIMRLARELGIIRQSVRTIFNESSLAPVPLQSVRDDNFVINMWNGDLANPAYAVTPLGYLRSIAKETFGEIAAQGKNKLAANGATFRTSRGELKGLEMLGIEDVPLFEALKQWGHRDANGKRDLARDYRYPHEWLSVWYDAQQMLAPSAAPEEKAAVMIGLAGEAQASVIAEAQSTGVTPHNIDLAGALAQMNGGSIRQPEDLNKFDADLGLPAGTLIGMHRVAEKMVVEAGYRPANPLAGYLPPAAKPGDPSPA